MQINLTVTEDNIRYHSQLIDVLDIQSFCSLPAENGHSSIEVAFHNWWDLKPHAVHIEIDAGVIFFLKQLEGIKLAQLHGDDTSGSAKITAPHEPSVKIPDIKIPEEVSAELLAPLGAVYVDPYLFKKATPQPYGSYIFFNNSRGNVLTVAEPVEKVYDAIREAKASSSLLRRQQSFRGITESYGL